MTKARIYRPEKSAMQSGMANTRQWVLEFAPEKPFFVDNLMGWVGMTDMPREVIMHFPTQEEAIAYAKRMRIDYELALPKPRRLVRKAYADNFAYNKPAT